MNGWVKDGNWARWHYAEGDALLCGRVPDNMPKRRLLRVATSQRCALCDLERGRRALPPGPQTKMVLDYLDAVKGPPLVDL